MKKLRSRRGETLAEVLVALLIVTLATLMLAAMATTSTSISLTARQKDEEFYKALSEVEAMQDDRAVKDGGTLKEFTVNITESGGTQVSTATVYVYTSDDNGLALYKEKP